MTYKWTLPTIETHGREATENEIQMAFVQWFRRSFPGVLIFAIPNGGKRSKSEALRLKTEGVTAGVPDIFCPKFRAFWELKRNDGGKGASSEQILIADHLASVGYSVEVCNGFEEAKAFAIRVSTEHGVKPCL